MKIYYETPEAEIIDFAAREKLAWIDDSRPGTGGNEDIGPDVDGDATSRDF